MQNTVDSSEGKKKPRGRPKLHRDPLMIIDSKENANNSNNARPRGRPIKFKSLEEQRAGKREYYQTNKKIIHDRMNAYYRENKAYIREQYNKRQSHFKFLQEFYDTWKDKVDTVK